MPAGARHGHGRHQGVLRTVRGVRVDSKKWNQLKLKVLADFAAKQRKLHLLSSKICVDLLIEIIERHGVLLDTEYERELRTLRRSLQIY